MRKTNRANIELINTVANRLGPLLDKVVFLGGAATGLLITDTAALRPLHPHSNYYSGNYTYKLPSPGGR